MLWSTLHVVFCINSLYSCVVVKLYCGFNVGGTSGPGIIGDFNLITHFKPYEKAQNHLKPMNISSFLILCHLFQCRASKSISSFEDKTLL